MQDQRDFEAKMRNLVGETAPSRFKKVTVTGETRLKQDLGIDSIGLIAILFRFQQTFLVDLNATDVATSINKIRTFDDALRLGREIIENSRKEEGA